MRAWGRKLLALAAEMIMDRMQRPMEELKRLVASEHRTLNDKLDAQGEEMRSTLGRHEAGLDALLAWKAEAQEKEAVALECDLAILDDRICSQIALCRRKGYTTEEERRRVNRMHKAYQARGGNHGEENEYRLFRRLPTEEAFGGMQ